MTKDAFLKAIRLQLAGLPDEEIEEIVEDYAAYFVESAASGRNDTEVAASLGDPIELARALRTAVGVRRLEANWSVSNLVAATSALVGLAVFDVLFLLPLLIVTLLITLGIAIALVVIGALGLKMIIATILFDLAGAPVMISSRLFVGIGLVTAFLGGGAFLLLCFGSAVRVLARYARLHSRVTRPIQAGFKHKAKLS